MAVKEKRLHRWEDCRKVGKETKERPREEKLIGRLFPTLPTVKFVFNVTAMFSN